MSVKFEYQVWKKGAWTAQSCPPLWGQDGRNLDSFWVQLLGTNTTFAIQPWSHQIQVTQMPFKS